ncbi:ZP domain-containing protein [Caerostris darwini]|uniref:ZP domain-containing protein n=1 Tax=Caerostris darwini TaxID=1538125 RepID=A0AAV4RW95_9ARAC|nr:ZP domain-containing protein [Caerostris darwini]
MSRPARFDQHRPTAEPEPEIASTHLPSTGHSDETINRRLQPSNRNHGLMNAGASIFSLAPPSLHPHPVPLKNETVYSIEIRGHLAALQPYFAFIIFNKQIRDDNKKTPYTFVYTSSTTESFDTGSVTSDGHNIFYQRVIIEKSIQKEKELLFMQCVIPGDFNMEFVRLDWLRESVPYNFSLPTSPPITDALDIVPYVNIAIRDKGQQLDTSAIVHPGTMLDLLIYLDKESSAHYDISLRYLTLTDATRGHEEVVVMNGCSVDPFVLDVFPSSDGVLRSQFRAFKFQSSDFVIFLATVSVCLQQCVEKMALEANSLRRLSARRRRGTFVCMTTSADVMRIRSCLQLFSGNAHGSNAQ